MALSAGRVGVNPRDVDSQGHVQAGSKIKPVTKTADMTQPVGVDSSGKLFTAPANALHEYSTTEKEVGKWVDGKKIYEIVVPMTNNLSSDLSDLNIDTIIKLDAPGEYSPIKFTMDSVSGTVQRALYYSTSTKKVHADGSTSVSYAIIQYTKTT